MSKTMRQIRSGQEASTGSPAKAINEVGEEINRKIEACVYMFCTPDHTQLTPKQPAGGTKMWNETEQSK